VRIPDDNASSRLTFRELACFAQMTSVCHSNSALHCDSWVKKKKEKEKINRIKIERKGGSKQDYWEYQVNIDCSLQTNLFSPMSMIKSIICRNSSCAWPIMDFDNLIHLSHEEVNNRSIIQWHDSWKFAWVIENETSPKREYIREKRWNDLASSLRETANNTRCNKKIDRSIECSMHACFGSNSHGSSHPVVCGNRPIYLSVEFIARITHDCARNVCSRLSSTFRYVTLRLRVIFVIPVIQFSSTIRRQRRKERIPRRLLINGA